jgi:hypothetical protein
MAFTMRPAVVVMSLALACSSVQRETAPPIEDCQGTHCRPSPGSGSTPSPEASVSPGSDGGADSAQSFAVTLDITATIDTAFFDVQPFNAPVVINGESEDGRRWSTGTTPVRPPASIDVSPGNSWIAVIDGGPVRVIASTLQRVTIDGAQTSLSLRALSWDALTSMFIDNEPWAPLAGTATVMLVFRRGGAPLRGVTVLPPTGTSVAYFESGSRYTTEGPTAGFDSTVLVRDIGRLPAYPALTSLTLQYQVGTATALVPVRVAPDFVTWVNLDVP